MMTLGMAVCFGLDTLDMLAIKNILFDEKTPIHVKVNLLWTSDVKWWHIRVNTGSGDGLVPDDTKPSPEPMLTYHQFGSVAFIFNQFHKKHLYINL